MKKNRTLKFLSLFFLLQALWAMNALGQITISGTVYDSSKLYVIPGVSVYSTSGATAITDSLGAYHINVTEKDSLSFFYRGKSTVKFAVKTMNNYTAFDVSLLIRVKDNKYKLLKGVTVFSNTYQEDSIENRLTYAKGFNPDRPGIHSTYEDGGAAGLDFDALVGAFQFKKNKENKAFQKRLMGDEEDQYVDNRFNSKIISRITGLKGDTLLRYKKLYRPSYFFVATSTLTEFYEYILNTSYAFRRDEGIK